MKPTANADNLYLGAGTVLFDRFTAAGARTGLRPLGNTESFELTTTVEEIEKKDDTDGARQTLRKDITGTEAVLAAVLNEYTVKNLALGLLGDEAAVQQVSTTLTDQSLNDGDPLEFDRWYDLGGFHHQVTNVKQGGPALVVDTDYEINDDGSMIRLLSTGGGSDTVATTFSAYRPGLARVQIQGLTTPRITGHLRFISATNQVAGKRVQADFPRVSIRPDGALPFIGEEYGSFTLNATVEKDPNAAPGTPSFTIEQIPLASEATS